MGNTVNAYCGDYIVGNQTYCIHGYSDSVANAETLLDYLGAKYTGKLYKVSEKNYRPATYHIERRQWKKALHAWVYFMEWRRRFYQPSVWSQERMFIEGGVLHEIIHQVVFTEKQLGNMNIPLTHAQLLAEANAQELAIPGFRAENPFV